LQQLTEHRYDFFSSPLLPLLIDSVVADLKRVSDANFECTRKEVKLLIGNRRVHRKTRIIKLVETEYLTYVVSKFIASVFSYNQIAEVLKLVPGSQVQINVTSMLHHYSLLTKEVRGLVTIYKSALEMCIKAIQRVYNSQNIGVFKKNKNKCLGSFLIASFSQAIGAELNFDLEQFSKKREIANQVFFPFSQG